MLLRHLLRLLRLRLLLLCTSAVVLTVVLLVSCCFFRSWCIANGAVVNLVWLCIGVKLMCALHTRLRLRLRALYARACASVPARAHWHNARGTERHNIVAVCELRGWL